MKIGLFDSGVGGLTCLTSLLKPFAHDQFVYLGDTARLPYGTKSKSTIESYVAQNIEFLKKTDVDIVISACHSASTVLVDTKEVKGIPTFEVISPACSSLSSKTKKVGLMATAATVASGSYEKTLAKTHPGTKLVAQACPLLVPLVECGWIQDPVTQTVLRRYLKPLLAASPEAIILGCTHFPVLKTAIRALVPPEIQLIDPGEALAHQMMSVLGRSSKENIKDKQQKRDSKDSVSTNAPALSDNLEFYLTDCSPHFIDLAKKLLPEELETIAPEHVQLRP